MERGGWKNQMHFQFHFHYLQYPSIPDGFPDFLKTNELFTFWKMELFLTGTIWLRVIKKYTHLPNRKRMPCIFHIFTYQARTSIGCWGGPRIALRSGSPWWLIEGAGDCPRDDSRPILRSRPTEGSIPPSRTKTAIRSCDQNKWRRI